MASIHVGDIGTMFKLTVKDQNSNIVVLDNTFSLKVTFLLPDASVIDRVASLFTDGSDGIIEYVTVAGDLPQAGNWQLQAVVSKYNSSYVLIEQWHSDSVKFKVVANLE